MKNTTASSISKILVASYIFDWIVIIGIAVIAYGFTKVTPHYHNFSVLDLSISYPLKADTVPIWVVGVVAGVVPALIIFGVSWIIVPGPAASRGKGWRYLVAIKFWEWISGWLGLALSLATTVMITQGLKNFGKPRPNMLARCNPDINNIGQYVVGGYGQDISARWVMVDQRICQQTDLSVLNDGFQSWPSGHSSTSWAGLLYLTLYLCSKFAVVLPHLPVRTSDDIEQTDSDTKFDNATSIDTQRRPMLARYGKTTRSGKPLVRARDEAAAPPVYGLFAILVPLGGALYICLSRYMDYAHHGFDIISGSIIGIVCAWFSFRLYHLPIARGSGWSWGPRSRDRAFGVGVGSHGYVDETRFTKASIRAEDMEMGTMGAESSRVNGAQRWAGESETQSPLVGAAPATGNSALNGSTYSQPAYARDARYQGLGSSSDTAPAETAYEPRVY